MRRAAEVYATYAGRSQEPIQVVAAEPVSSSSSAKDLKADSSLMLEVLKQCGEWDPERDAKLDRLAEPCLTRKHSDEKVLVFTQFADTVAYLTGSARIPRDRPAWPGSPATPTNPTKLAWRFSPESNEQAQRGAGRQGAPRADRHRCPERGPEPPGLRDHRQLRPSLGHHPADPAGGPRRPHRPEGRQDSLLLLPAGRRRRADHQLRARVASGSRRMPRSSEPTRRSSRTTGTIRPSATCSPRRPASSTARPTPRSTWPPTPTRSGRTRSTRTRPWSGSSRTCPTWSTRPDPTRPTEREPEGVLALCPHGRGQRRPGLGRPERPEHHRIAVRHPQGCGVRAEHPRAASPA